MRMRETGTDPHATTADRSRLPAMFTQFVDSERAAGILLAAFTLLALLIANSPLAPSYHQLLESRIAGMSLGHWVNDGLMAVFFLLIGLELEREFYSGELSDPRRAALPALAAVGGMVAPAAIHLALNAGTPTQHGFGIPMATDIAFAMGALALLGTRVPTALKVFVVAFAVMDDLGAVVVIAVFYTADLSRAYLGAAIAVFAMLVVLNRYARTMALAPYLIGGAVMWWLLLRSGVHATLAGVALAFAIPYSSRAADLSSPSHRLELILHRPVPLIILPIFALANTGVAVGAGWAERLLDANSAGIILGLVVGKPIGVALFAFAAVASGVCRLPSGVSKSHILGAGLLGGIGFTMSIFITNLAFADAPATTEASKLAILAASLIAGAAGYLWLRFVAPPGADTAAGVSP
jgi:NhaA family Na+:H+ antiporter